MMMRTPSEKKMMIGVTTEKILLHACCGPCSTAAIYQLSSKLHYHTFAYFFNPNIWPYTEYIKRLTEFEKVAKHFKIEYISENYSEEEYALEHQKWKKYLINHLENEPSKYKEGSKRCDLCFRYRLLKTAEFAKKNNIKQITTSLSLGPTKNVSHINKIGEEISKELKISYLKKVFRKNNGWNYSISKSKELNLYRQEYCGCEFSLAERKLQKMKNSNHF